MHEITPTYKESRSPLSPDVLREIYDHIADQILLIKIIPNGAYRLIAANQAFFVATGFKENETIGKLVKDILPPPLYTVLREKYEEVLETGSAVRYERESELPNGTKTFQIEIFPIVDSDGDITHFLGMSRDITELAQLRAENTKLKKERQ